MKLAYAGSFDPVTNGHVHVIEKALGLGQEVEVVVIVANNPAKNHRFTLSERVDMIAASIPHPRLSIRELPNNIYTVEFARVIGCMAMLRGIRTEPDFQEETNLYHANRLVCNDIETIYIMPDLDLSTVRSSTAMSMVGPRHWTWSLDKLVPQVVMQTLCRQWCLQKVVDCLLSGNHASEADRLRLCDLLEDICKLYSGQDYHGWSHIAYFLAEIQFLAPELLLQSELVLAVLLHDVVDPSVVTSDEVAELIKSVNLSEQINYSRISKLIHATDHGMEMDFSLLNADFGMIHDIDLSILAAPWNRYQVYAMAVRQEYRAKFTTAEFCTGRKIFLEGMLAREKIFALEIYNDLDARRNMQQEIDQLLV